MNLATTARLRVASTRLSPPDGGTLRWSVLLLCFWVLLSGRLDLVHLALGVCCSLAVAVATRSLLALPPAIGLDRAGTSAPALLLRLLRFQAWLLLQIVVGSLQVAWVVLHPRLPIAPRLLRLRVDLKSPVARLTLANAITLTPGTATLDAEGDELLVHALTEASARALCPERGEGEMPRRVRAAFFPGGGAR